MSVILTYPEGPHIQPLGNWDPKFLLQYSILEPDSLIVVYMDPLGKGCDIYIYMYNTIPKRRI